MCVILWFPVKTVWIFFFQKHYENILSFGTDHDNLKLWREVGQKNYLPFFSLNIHNWETLKAKLYFVFFSISFQLHFDKNISKRTAFPQYAVSKTSLHCHTETWLGSILPVCLCRLLCYGWDLRGLFYKYTLVLEENLGCTNTQTCQHTVSQPHTVQSREKAHNTDSWWTTQSKLNCPEH